MINCYIDIRDDKETPFYVGIGNDDRVKCGERNNLYHTNITKKTKWNRVIVTQFKNREEANKWEIETIFQLRSRGITLANKTNGGDGTSGYKHSEESRTKNSNAKKGDNNPKYWLGKKRPEMSERQKGENNPAWKGYWHTTSGKFSSVREAAKEFNVTPATIRNRCLSKTKRFQDWYFESMGEK